MVYVISDIHGRKDRFFDILNQIKLTKTDTLYVLGDVIDRNPYGLDLLKYIMKHPNIKMILGNHEYMMLNALESQEKIGVWYRNGGEITHKRWKKQRITTRGAIVDYLNKLPLTIELNINEKEYLLVHGKQASDKSNSCQNHDDLVRDVVWGRIKVEDRGQEKQSIIFGHTRTSHYNDCKPLKIWYGEHLIGIDCGAAYSDGRLACLRLDDMTEFYSTC